MKTQVELTDDELSMILDAIIESGVELNNKWGEKFIDKTHERLLQIYQEQFG